MLRHIRSVRGDRGRLFERVQDLFDDARVHQDGLDYPVLRATYRGHPIRLDPVLDALAFRKLPVLWLRATHLRPLAVDAPVSMLLRPNGSEFFSPNAGFQGELDASLDFPAHLRIASPDPAGAPAMPPCCLPFLADARAKELYVTAEGVRVVWRLAEASQTHYRTTRRADFGSVRVEASQLEFLLHTLTTVGEELAAVGVA